MTRTRMALIAAACITAGASLNVAMDGGGPPREGTRVEASPFEAPLIVAAPLRSARTPVPPEVSAQSPLGIEQQELELSSADRGARDQVLLQWLSKLVEQDPEAAARFAEKQTGLDMRELTLRQVALLWGALDPERAVNWARSLPDPGERNAAIADVAHGLSSIDPRRGVELREQFVAATRPDGALSDLVQQWAGYDFDGALAWTNARAPGAQRDALLQRLIYVRAAAGDPAAAAGLIAGSSLSGLAQTAAIESVAREWALRDKDAALEWLRTLDLESAAAAIAEITAGSG